MPQTTLQVFRDAKGRIPLVEWLDDLEEKSIKAYANGADRLQELERLGSELDRPLCGFLKDGIYELRWKLRNVQYRILYFFHGENAVILTQGFIKTGNKVDPLEINRAKTYRELVEKNADKYTAEFELD